MKRSEINAVIEHALAFQEERRVALPQFAHWSLQEWQDRRDDAQELIDAQLGWDITDFGSGDFERVGLFLFTLRNGTSPDSAKTYAEKILVVEPGQVTPTHFHYFKMEDIINRGGGNLVVQLWNSTPGHDLDTSEVRVRIDGLEHVVPAGGSITLRPGDSVCLSPFLYHQFWGEGATVLVGEVSRVNDDRTDNHFHAPVGRFPLITEDAWPLRLLTSDYAALL